MQNEKYLEVSKVAIRLHVSPATVYRMIKAGLLQRRRMGVVKGFMVPESSVFTLEKQRLEEMGA